MDLVDPLGISQFASTLAISLGGRELQSPHLHVGVLPLSVGIISPSNGARLDGTLVIMELFERLLSSLGWT